MKDRVRRILIAAALLTLVASLAGLLVLRAGRPMFYTDGDREILASELANAPMVVWDPPEPELEIPGPVLGRIETLPDGRLLYGRGTPDGTSELVLFDPGRPGTPPESAFVLNSRGHDLAPVLTADGVLYFASDRRGGAGGFDLYRARYRQGVFRAVERLPDWINTMLDETDPAPDPRGDRIVFVQRDPDLNDGQNGTLMVASLEIEDVSAPLYEPRQPAPLDRDPAFAADGVSLWFVRELEAGAAVVMRAWRLRDQFAPPLEHRSWRSAGVFRAPDPSADGFALRLVQPGTSGEPGTRALVYRARAREVFPWWAGQAGLELFLFATAILCATLLLLLLLGRRWRQLDVVTWCLLVSFFLHLLLLLLLTDVEIVRRFMPTPPPEGRLEVELVSGQEASRGGGLEVAQALSDPNVDLQFAGHTRELEAAAPGSEVADALRREAERGEHAAEAPDAAAMEVDASVQDAAAEFAPRSATDARAELAAADATTDQARAEEMVAARQQVEVKRVMEAAEPAAAAPAAPDRAPVERSQATVEVELQPAELAATHAVETAEPALTDAPSAVPLRTGIDAPDAAVPTARPVALAAAAVVAQRAERAQSAPAELPSSSPSAAGQLAAPSRSPAERGERAPATPAAEAMPVDVALMDRAAAAQPRRGTDAPVAIAAARAGAPQRRAAAAPRAQRSAVETTAESVARPDTAPQPASRSAVARSVPAAPATEPAPDVRELAMAVPSLSDAPAATPLRQAAGPRPTATPAPRAMPVPATAVATAARAVRPARQPAAQMTATRPPAAASMLTEATRTRRESSPPPAAPSVPARQPGVAAAPMPLQDAVAESQVAPRATEPTETAAPLVAAAGAVRPSAAGPVAPRREATERSTDPALRAGSGATPPPVRLETARTSPVAARSTTELPTAQARGASPSVPLRDTVAEPTTVPGTQPTSAAPAALVAAAAAELVPRAPSQTSARRATRELDAARAPRGAGARPPGAALERRSRRSPAPASRALEPTPARSMVTAVPLRDGALPSATPVTPTPAAAAAGVAPLAATAASDIAPRTEALPTPRRSAPTATRSGAVDAGVVAPTAALTRAARRSTRAQRRELPVASASAATPAVALRDTKAAPGETSPGAKSPRDAEELALQPLRGPSFAPVGVASLIAKPAPRRVRGLDRRTGAIRIPGSLLQRAPRSGVVPLPQVAAAADVPELFANRFGNKKAEALERYGGTAETERAVRMGLEYLASIQNRNGSWGSRRRMDDKYGQVYLGKSGLCLLAFLGAGHTPTSDTEYSEVARRAVRHLLSQQDPDSGHFGTTSSYTHGIVTYALAECYGMTRDDQLREPVSAAVDWILANQNRGRDQRNAGGWGYYSDVLPAEDRYSRTSITVWMVMALESAKLAGFDISDRPLSRARGFLLNAWDRTYGYFRYNHKRSRLISDWPTLPSSTPGAVFALTLLGQPKDDMRLRVGIDYTVARRPRFYEQVSEDDFVLKARGNVYFWYYGSLACFLTGGDAWEAWNAALKDVLPRAQNADGSFEPIDPYAEIAGDNKRDKSYTTAMCVLSLEVYYRYFTPLLENR